MIGQGGLSRRLDGSLRLSDRNGRAGLVPGRFGQIFILKGENP